MVRRTLTGLLCLLLVAGAWADPVSFTAQVNSNSVPMGGQLILQVSLSGSSNGIMPPQLPPLDGFNAYATGTQSNIAIINNQMSQVLSYTYTLTPTSEGRHIIPPLTATVDGQTYQTEPITVTVTPAQAAPTAPGQAQSYAPPGGWQPIPDRLGPAHRVFVEAEASPKDAYVNEPITYTFRFFHAVGLARNPSFEPPSATGFLREDLPQRTYMTERNGVRYSVSEVKTMFFPTAPGSFEIGPARLTCELNDFDPSLLMNDDYFRDFFATGRVRDLTTDPITIRVKSLPSEGRPADFTGAVGNFSMEASLDKSVIKAGEVVNLRVVVRGDGHPDLYPRLMLPPLKGFKTFPAKSTTNLGNQENFEGTHTFTVPLVPTEAGERTLNGIRFSYFDPAENRYQTIEAPPLDLQVEPGEHPQPEVSPGASPGETPDGPTPNGVVVRPIHTRSALSGPTGWIWGAGFWLLQLVPMGLVLSYLSWLSFKGYRHATAGQRRRSSAARRAERSLRSASETGLHRIFHEYLKDKLGSPTSGLSYLDLRQLLGQHGVSPEVAQDLCHLLEEADQARYAPGGAGQLPVDRARTLLSRLEAQLR